MKLGKKDRLMLQVLLKPLPARGFSVTSGRDARNVGKMFAKLGIRDDVLIARDRKRNVTVVVDLNVTNDIYSVFSANRLNPVKPI